jgi:hypothetical protein
MSRHVGQFVLLIISVAISCAWWLDHRALRTRLDEQERQLADLRTNAAVAAISSKMTDQISGNGPFDPPSLTFHLASHVLLSKPDSPSDPQLSGEINVDMPIEINWIEDRSWPNAPSPNGWNRSEAELREAVQGFYPLIPKS